MNLFLPFMTASLVAAFAWTIMTFRIDRDDRRLAGLVGAWIATVILAALWQAEAVPWLWVIVKIVILVWLGALALVVTSAVSYRRVKQPAVRAILSCAIFSIAVNVAAGLVLLWQAVASPGGV